MAGERPVSSELEAFLVAGEPPVYFGVGSMRAQDDLATLMAGAARALGRRAIVSRGWADLSLAEDTPDCPVIGDVNHQAVCKRVAAVATTAERAQPPPQGLLGCRR